MSPETFAAARLEASAGGLEGSRRVSDLYDGVLRRLFGEQGGREIDLPLLATGGYGRREMSPNSDVDLLFLTDDAEAAAPVVEKILHALWDLGLQVGFATRDVAGSVQLASEDLHTATALLTARTIGGDPAGNHALRAALLAHFSGAEGDALIAALGEDLERRHARYGGSVYLLEPNLKQSPGGLRDLHTIVWAAAVAFRVGSQEELLSRGVCTPRAAKELERARDFMLEVRNALHRLAPYGGDRLTFEHQERVAEALGFGARKTSVERFMAKYYQHASAARRRCELTLAACRERGKTRRRSTERRVGACFRIFSGHLTVADPKLFEKDPAQAMHLFSAARREGVPIHGFAKDRLMESVPELIDDVDWRLDPAVIQSFVEVLTNPEDPCDALGDMHEAGVLGAVIPEFGAVTHRTQHDLYHVYTVDIHTLRAIRQLKALHRGELAAEHPLLTQAVTRIGDALPLYLGLLMHDAGKALGRGHAVKGARLVPGIGRRLGLPQRHTRDAEWLVRDHLLMAHLSQRRDLSDDALIAQFCRQVGSEENLARLFVLTWADASTTGPQAYTEWKAALLHELYARAQQRFRFGLDLYEDPKRRVARLRKAVSDWLERQGELEPTDVNSRVDRFFASLPTAYFQRTRARDVARHIQLIAGLDDRAVAWETNARSRRGYTNLHVVAPSQPGLVSAVCGVLAIHDLDVVTAELHLSTDGQAIYVFQISGTEDVWEGFGPDLERVLGQEVDVDELLDAAHSRRGRYEWPEGPAVETRLTYDQSHSERCTVLDLKTRDRPGLLYSVLRSFQASGVQLVLARITTDSDAAHDTFYLQSAEGQKLSDEAAGAALEAVSEALAL